VRVERDLVRGAERVGQHADLHAALAQRADGGHLRLRQRHTYASLLIDQRESLTYIRDQMGHHSIRVTVDTYGHLVPGGNKAAVDRLDDAPDATVRNPAATATRGS
jgi:integrase